MHWLSSVKKIDRKTTPLLVTAAVCIGILGYILGTNNIFQTTKYSKSNRDYFQSISQPGSVIKNQQALASGTITKVSNDTISLKDEKGVITTFKLAPQFT